MVQLMTDPTSLLTKLSNKLDYGQFLPGANPVVEAARQRLANTQQDLLSQNAMLQQRQQQQRAMRQQLLASLRNASTVASYGLPAGVARNSAGSAPGGSVGPAPRGQVLAWIDQALNLNGNTGSRRSALENGLYQMIMHESGGNPRAQNNWDSNAKAGTPSIGMMQTIAPTFNAYAIKGHRNIYNPVDNILAGLRYALSRYGYGMVMGGGRHDAYGNYIGY